MFNRASAPARPRNRHAAHWRVVADHLRRGDRKIGAEIADGVRLARASVARGRKQDGGGRRKALEPKEPTGRDHREWPGELIHIDIKKMDRFEKIGHRLTGDRRRGRNPGVGRGFVHVAIEDATRLASVEVLADKKRGSATGGLVRALSWFRDRGVRL